MIFQFKAISGFMLGIEVLWEFNAVAIDLGIVRMYVGVLPRRKIDG